MCWLQAEGTRVARHITSLRGKIASAEERALARSQQVPPKQQAGRVTQGACDPSKLQSEATTAALVGPGQQMGVLSGAHCCRARARAASVCTHRVHACIPMQLPA